VINAVHTAFGLNSIRKIGMVIMKKTKILAVALVLAFISLGLIQFSSAESTVFIGVLAKRGAGKAFQQWGPTAEYLSKRLKRDIKILPLKFTEIEPALKSNKIDFLLANSAFYARLEEKYGLKAILTMANRRGIVALDEFGGVIFARKNRNIKELKDIKGKKFMCVKYSSFGGAHMAWRLLLESGIDPKKDCTAFLEGKTHDNVVMAVKEGLVDVGTVRSDTLERMADEGKIRMRDFTIINQINDGFPFVHSTRLYPEWPFAACAKATPELRKQVAKALYLIQGDHPAMVASKVFSWTRPAKYSEVTACLRVIGEL
jgi:phosphate/phosphite/phosphonate ABC transporter binding protein